MYKIYSCPRDIVFDAPDNSQYQQRIDRTYPGYEFTVLSPMPNCANIMSAISSVANPEVEYHYTAICARIMVCIINEQHQIRSIQLNFVKYRDNRYSNPIGGIVYTQWYSSFDGIAYAIDKFSVGNSQIPLSNIPQFTSTNFDFTHNYLECPLSAIEVNLITCFARELANYEDQCKMDIV